MACGVVLKNMQDQTLRTHLVLHSKRLTTFQAIRDEVVDIRRTQLATGSTPMDIGAFSYEKGNGRQGQRQRCWEG